MKPVTSQGVRSSARLQGSRAAAGAGRLSPMGAGATAPGALSAAEDVLRSDVLDSRVRGSRERSVEQQNAGGVPPSEVLRPAIDRRGHSHAPTSPAAASYEETLRVVDEWSGRLKVRRAASASPLVFERKDLAAPDETAAAAAVPGAVEEETGSEASLADGDAAHPWESARLMGSGSAEGRRASGDEEAISAMEAEVARMELAVAERKELARLARARFEEVQGSSRRDGDLVRATKPGRLRLGGAPSSPLMAAPRARHETPRAAEPAPPAAAAVVPLAAVPPPAGPLPAGAGLRARPATAGAPASSPVTDASGAALVRALLGAQSELRDQEAVRGSCPALVLTHQQRVGTLEDFNRAVWALLGPDTSRSGLRTCWSHAGVAVGVA